jgi:hypothetical protein
MRLLRLHRRIIVMALKVAATAVAAFTLYTFTPLHKPLDWLMLDLSKFNDLVDEHMRQAHETAEYACVYTFKCENGAAVLELRTSLTEAEFDAVKASIWRRKFEDYCPGRTTNFGIENSGEAEALEQGWENYRRRDIWFDGGFMGESGRFAGGSFAPAGGWQRCTRDKAYWTRGAGIVAGSASR